MLFCYREMFVFRKRSAFDYLDFISDFLRVADVMRLVAFRNLDEFLILGVFNEAFHLDHDGVFHFVGDNDAGNPLRVSCRNY